MLKVLEFSYNLYKETNMTYVWKLQLKDKNKKRWKVQKRVQCADLPISTAVQWSLYCKSLNLEVSGVTFKKFEWILIR